MKESSRWLVAALLVLMLCGPSAAADTVDTVKQRGALICGVKGKAPGFGFVGERNQGLVGYDVDFCAAVARKMGVRLELQTVTSATRIPQLTAGHIDLIAATMTKTPERAKLIDFSYTYFLTGQKFLVKKGTARRLSDLDGRTVGTARGSTSEKNVRKALPHSTLLSFDHDTQAFLALEQGKVFAVTTDGPILAGMLGKSPQRGQYEIPPDLVISQEPYGLGVRKGDARFLHLVNETLLEMERTGEARRIFAKWFGPKSAAPMSRGKFKISAAKLDWEK